PPFAASLVENVAASFQAAIVDTLVAKTMRALDATGARALNLGGGVACNGELRRRLAVECERRGVALRIPSPRLCADNAAMIAQLGAPRPWSRAVNGLSFASCATDNVLGGTLASIMVGRPSAAVYRFTRTTGAK